MSKGRPNPTKSTSQSRALARKRHDEGLQALEKAVAALDPKTATMTAFSQLPLSRPTLAGLEAAHYKTLTDIQARAIPHALKGADCLGAAKTGSGKTLAFLIPVLEALYRRRWSELDGLGALIISPTRELAIQIFEVLRKIGCRHPFSAGLVIGGKSLQEERDRLGRMNILVCTPGRMLQHLDQTALLEHSNLQMLVLDEADRLMDDGFQSVVDAILGHLPPDRQTLLFSATQTKKVADLARLSLKEPEYIAVHEQAPTATPATLQQHYVITPLPDKVNTLFSFLRSNVKAKILVFLSSGKQVRFVYETFRRLQPGLPLLHLLGRQKQSARLEITHKFSAAKHACLFATDVVARGLDFPAVDWVVQVDCPEDAETYIHRVGRTARYERRGRAVLFLDRSEEAGMLKRLEHVRVPIERIQVRAKKQQSIKDDLQRMCFQDPDLKYLAQKAVKSYLRSVHMQKDKEIFQLQALPLADFAASLGLAGVPQMNFSPGADPKTLKNAPRPRRASSSDDDDGDGDENDPNEPRTNGATKRKRKEEPARTKYDRMFERRNQDVLADHYTAMIQPDDGEDDGGAGTDATRHRLHADADEDDSFLTVKRRLNVDEPTNGNGLPVPRLPTAHGAPLVIDSKRREKMLRSKKKLLKFKGKGTKLVFDDDGVAHDVYPLADETQFRRSGDPESLRQRYLAQEGLRALVADQSDKLAAKAKRREKMQKRKGRAAERDGEGERGVDDSGSAVVLAPSEEGDGEGQGEGERERARKRPRKWFEHGDDDDADDEDGARHAGRQRKRHERQRALLDAPGTSLEELEALATGLIG
ncbi:MAG: ATP-dependent RNA helicase dbp4 [Phylliscum demangeonii]|nr:MAG: ATP-dependent RNA helicase dbp4 [Phylliscum demangeonii]